MAHKRPTVIVSRKIGAIEEPRFLIESEGKLYLTAAVLEYDPQHPELEDDHRQTIDDLRREFETCEPVRAVRLGRIHMTMALIAANAVGPDPNGDGGG